MSTELEFTSILTSCKATGYTACNAAIWILGTGPLVLLCLGTCGNLMTITILSRRRLRTYSTTVYLLFLAVADLVALWTLALKEILIFFLKLDINDLSWFNCKTNRWVFQTSASFSVWLLVLLTLERVFYTKFPVIAKVRMTRRLAVSVSLVVLVIVAVLQSHYILGYEMTIVGTVFSNGTAGVLDAQKCIAVSGSYRSILENFVAPVGVFVCVVLPCLVLIVGNLTIAMAIWRQHRKVAPAFLQPRQVSTCVRKNINTTKMLFLISGFFMFCIIPYGIVALVYLTRRKVCTDFEMANIKLAFAVVTVLMMSNFTFNFLLYSVGGSLFRKELFQVMQRVKLKLYECFTRSVNEVSNSNIRVFTTSF